MLANIAENAIVKSARDVNLSATDDSDMNVVAIGFAGGGSGSTGIAVNIAGAGSGAGNDIVGTIDASVKNSTVTAARNLSASAMDTSDMNVVAGAIAGGGAGGGRISVAGSVGVSAADNNVSRTVRANVDGSTVSASGVHLTASSDAIINSITVGGALAIAAGTNVGVGVAAGGAGSGNRIHKPW